MNCFNHPETLATAYCRSCGKALCEECKRPAFGTVYCSGHVPEAASTPGAPPPPPPAVPTAIDTSPAVAAVLGFIPGVGAIYNGQYAKGLVHAVIFGMLISIQHSAESMGLEGVFVMLSIAFYLYMPIEAYHTARKRRAGEPVDEFSSLIDLRSQGRFPTAAVALIVLGGILLLNTLGILDFHNAVRYWPVMLILIGVYMLYSRVSPPTTPAREVEHERR